MIYTTVIYTNSTLTNIYKPSSAEYYSFHTDFSEPFTTLGGSAKFGTDGLKMSPNLISDPCNDQYFRACQGNSQTCAHPFTGAVGW